MDDQMLNWVKFRFRREHLFSIHEKLYLFFKLRQINPNGKLRFQEHTAQ